jgi:hypothetical protein
MNLPYFDLIGKVAIITGGATGVGHGLAVYLASPASDFMTGSCIIIDDGQVCCNFPISRTRRNI